MAGHLVGAPGIRGVCCAHVHQGDCRTIPPAPARALLGAQAPGLWKKGSRSRERRKWTRTRGHATLRPDLEPTVSLFSPQAAACFSALCKYAQEADLKPRLEELIDALVECMSGRTWDGKENAVSALVAIAVVCKAHLVDNAALLSKVGPSRKRDRLENMHVGSVWERDAHRGKHVEEKMLVTCILGPAFIYPALYSPSTRHHHPPPKKRCWLPYEKSATKRTRPTSSRCCRSYPSSTPNWSPTMPLRPPTKPWRPSQDSLWRMQPARPRTSASAGPTTAQ